jgi:hypothetical protein
MDKSSELHIELKGNGCSSGLSLHSLSQLALVDGLVDSGSAAEAISRLVLITLYHASVNSY